MPSCHGHTVIFPNFFLWVSRERQKWLINFIDHAPNIASKLGAWSVI